MHVRLVASGCIWVLPVASANSWLLLDVQKSMFGSLRFAQNDVGFFPTLGASFSMFETHTIFRVANRDAIRMCKSIPAASRCLGNLYVLLMYAQFFQHGCQAFALCHHGTRVFAT